MLVRGVRGATTVESNTREAILDAAGELLTAIVEANQLPHEHVASILFSTTADLNAEFPAVAARNLGWTDVALECVHEVNTEKSAAEIQHQYLRGARVLRRDLVEQQEATS